LQLAVLLAVATTTCVKAKPLRTRVHYAKLIRKYSSGQQIPLIGRNSREGGINNSILQPIISLDWQTGEPVPVKKGAGAPSTASASPSDSMVHGEVQGFTMSN